LFFTLTLLNNACVDAFLELAWMEAIESDSSSLPLEWSYMFTGFNVVSQFKGIRKKFLVSFSNSYDPNQCFDKINKNSNCWKEEGVILWADIAWYSKLTLTRVVQCPTNPSLVTILHELLLVSSFSEFALMRVHCTGTCHYVCQNRVRYHYPRYLDCENQVKNRYKCTIACI